MLASTRRLSLGPFKSLVGALSAVAGADLVAAALALGALVAAVFGAPEPPTWLLWLISLAIVVWGAWRRSRLNGSGRDLRPTGEYMLARVLLVMTAAAVAAARVGNEARWAVVVGTVFLAGALLGEIVALQVGRAARPYAANLPGISVRNRSLVPVRWLFVCSTAAIAAFASLSAVLRTGLPAWLWLLPTVAAGVAAAAVLADCLIRLRARQRAESRLHQALEDYAPAFLLYWEAPVGSSHQIAMWLPYLERLERRFIVVLRTPDTFAETVQLTEAPVIVRRYVSELDALITSSLKVAFFVNTAPKNAHMVHYLGVTQIQLNHGDSDKAPSYRRVFRMYDRNFVAGQAAIDRFASHGVEVPRKAFEIVGRPQVESIEVAAAPILASTAKRVLYAPTWFGYLEDSRYSSLPIGAALVQALINRGCSVIFRPHPWTTRTPVLAAAAAQIDEMLAADVQRTGRQHRFGPAATAGSIFDTFNAADAMVSDVSSVIPDFLYSEKPFVVTSMVPGVEMEEFIEEFPLAQAGYVLGGDLSNLDQVLSDLLDTDPVVGRRRELKTYYLGDFPAANYAEGFLAAARRYLDGVPQDQLTARDSA
jgi:CDP-Glycerol:Poly(glycerophosphate) glycerophosphotransferase